MTNKLVNSLRADPVSRLRLRDAVSVGPSDPIGRAVGLMADRRAGCVLVVEGGRLVGIFTEQDYVTRVVAASRDAADPVAAVMFPSPKTVTPATPVLAAVELMGEGQYRHLPVLGDDGRPVGVLSVKDVMHYLVEYFPAKVYNLPPTPAQAQPAREGA